MRADRVTRILRPSLALVALAALLVLLGLAIAGPAHAGTKATPPATPASKATQKSKATPSPGRSGTGPVVLQRGAEVQFGQDVIVPAGTTTPSVVAFGGNVVVNGRVTDAVVAFGGDITIRGTVGMSTIAFGGDVTLGPHAVLGTRLNPTDTSLVLFGGQLKQAPGATIVGQTQTFDAVNWGGAVGWVARGLFVHPWWGFSLIGWLLQTAFCLILALVIAALMPRQLRAVQENLGHKPWASLGWGALAFFIAGPAVLVVLVISIIGLLLVLPYVLFVLLAGFFATTGAAAFLAQKVLTGFGGKENLMLAVTLGVLGTTIVSQIPVAGPLLTLALMVFGIGAAVLGVADWRRRRREAAAAQAAAAAAGAAALAAAGGGPGPQASIITPIVSTSPGVPVGAVYPATSATAPQPGLAAAAPAAASADAVTLAADAASAVPAPAQEPVAAAAPAAPEPPQAPAPPAGQTAAEGGAAAGDVPAAGLGAPETPAPPQGTSPDEGDQAGPAAP